MAAARVLRKTEPEDEQREAFIASSEPEQYEETPPSEARRERKLGTTSSFVLAASVLLLGFVWLSGGPGKVHEQGSEFVQRWQRKGPKPKSAPEHQPRQIRWTDHPDYCLEVVGPTAHRGSLVHLSTCQAGNRPSLQHFLYPSTGVGQIQLASNPLLCVDVDGDKNHNGANLHLWHCLDLPVQHFYFSGNASKIRWEIHREKCIDVANHQVAPGTKVQIWDCLDDDSDQHFSASEASIADAVGCPRLIHWSNHRDFCVEYQGAPRNGAPVVLGACSPWKLDKQRFVFSASGKVQLASNPHLCLDVKDQRNVNGNTMQLWECVDIPQQDFEFGEKIRWSSHYEKCMDVRGHQLTPGTRIQIWDCLPLDSDQQFSQGACQLGKQAEPRVPLPQEAISKLKPRQLQWSQHPELCLATASSQIQNGEPVRLAMCDSGTYAASGIHDPVCEPRTHKTFLFSDKGGKIRLAANPDFCLDVKHEAPFDGNALQLWQCQEMDSAQDFNISDKIHWVNWDDKCFHVRDERNSPGAVVEIRRCSKYGTAQNFAARGPPAEPEQSQEPCQQRRGSFLVLGDWGWDKFIHGNLFGRGCQRAIGERMLATMEELGDVKFIINVGDSFYPGGLWDKNDPQWNTKWRHVYHPKLRDVPWYSVYGNHDTHHDPGMCTNISSQGAQINDDIDNKHFFYMPDYNWFKEHHDMDLEVVGLDMNKFMEGWNRSIPASEMSLPDCQYSKCTPMCKQMANERAEQGFDLLDQRLSASSAKNLIVFSHYPTDYFASVPEFLGKLRPTEERNIAYFGGHRHNTDQRSTFRTGPHDWLVGGGGGWSCDGQEQGFLVGEIDQDYKLRTYPVLVDHGVCCAI